jgi:tRNA A37 threonylcarbamoyltransferase TsaD
VFLLIQGIRNALKNNQTTKNSDGKENIRLKSEYTMNNAAMIGIIGYYNFLENKFRR